MIIVFFLKYMILCKYYSNELKKIEEWEWVGGRDNFGFVRFLFYIFSFFCLEIICLVMFFSGNDRI